MDSWYLVRFGVMRQVGRFPAASPGHERGETVVLRTHRGTELGEVLAPLVEASAGSPAAGSVRILRPAGPDDLARARQVEAARARCFDRCAQVFREGVWPLELIDAEPLLDDDRVVLHYLGPHRLDATGLVQALRHASGLDVLFEPVGRDAPEDADAPGGCGMDGCGGGGCGSHCSGCAVKELLAGRGGREERRLTREMPLGG